MTQTPLFYTTEEEHERLLVRLHTVSSMMHDCNRSRSWAYQMIASYPGQKQILCNLSTGRKELAIPRAYVRAYMARVRRGNPYWG